MIYTPLDWYWTVAGSVSQVYSSKRADFVSINDADFLAWNAKNSPTKIGSNADLGEALANAEARKPIPADMLDAFKARQADRLPLNVLSRVLFDVVNEIRALKGQQALTAAQFRSYLKDRV